MSIYMGGSSKFMIPVPTRPPILSPNKDADYSFPMPTQDRLPNLKLRDLPNNHQPFLSARAPLLRPHERNLNGYQIFEPYSWALTRRYRDRDVEFKTMLYKKHKQILLPSSVLMTFVWSIIPAVCKMMLRKHKETSV